MTTTTTPTYRAQYDGGKWHLGSVERAALCFCGCLLMTPEDTRKFALAIPAERRMYQTDDDLTKVTCGACRRNREYGFATGATTRPVPRPRGASTTITRVPGAGADNADELATRTRRRNPSHAATVTPAEAADLAAAAAVTNGDAAARPSKRRSAADRRNAQQAEDRARREALTAGADAAVAAIEAAVAEATGEPPITPTGDAPRPAPVIALAPVMSKAAKARALVDSGECATLAAARRYLADMGE